MATRRLARHREGWGTRIVKKTLKGDLMGRTGFKEVKQPRRKAGDEPEKAAAPTPSSPVAAAPPKATDATRRILEALRDDDVVVITEPLHPRHGRAIVLDRDHREISSVAQQAPSGTDANLAGAPSIPPVPPIPPHAAPPKPTAPLSSPRKKTIQATALQQEAAAPTARTLQQAEAAPAPGAARRAAELDGGAIALARSVIAEAVYREFGAGGSKVQQPKGMNFLLHPRRPAGVVRTQHNLMLPLPSGMATSHHADVVVELENGAVLMLDVVPSSVSVTELKARAFDALQLRRLDLAFSILVFVRAPGGMPQEQAEALGHGYDFHFGIAEDQVHSEQSFAALRARIGSWLDANGAK
ncbi:MAG: hypothetical protein QOD77_1435 [Thermoplasmata archaeon]|jgi:hypothetical protein|nr:hypothetical protein [Thermoplasmata archaeon]